MPSAQSNEEPLAAAPDERRGGRAPGGGHRAGRPDEDDVEVHGLSLGRVRLADQPGMISTCPGTIVVPSSRFRSRSS